MISTNEDCGIRRVGTAAVLVALQLGWFAAADQWMCRSHAAEPGPLKFDVRADTAYRELSKAYCWFHPRVAALPGFGQDGGPAVIMTIQKHLAADDHYSGLYYLRSNDLGRTWSGPTEIPELAWQKGPGDETIAVCDVTPGWHARTRRLIAIGTKLRYSPQGHQLLDQPRSHECAYATFDPATGRWTPWKMLALPDTDTKFFLVAPGCVQWLEQPDGSLLVPMYFKGRDGADYTSTVLHCSFDGQELKYVEHGDELAPKGGRGFVEPSLASYQGRYYLTLRNDAAAFIATSGDGLHYDPPRRWTFDDGQDLGSYNTQAHWLVHSDGLFLAYTRRGANNDHIARNRAPIFVAQVDPQKLQVLRRTEQALLPERGVMLGNFGAAAITAGESWVTDAEFMIGDEPHPRGADGTVWVGRVTWAQPNRLVVAPASKPAAPAAKPAAATPPPMPLDEPTRRELDAGRQSLARPLSERRPVPVSADNLRALDRWADADLFHKGLTWALQYDRQFDAKDVALLRKAVRRGGERLAALDQPVPPWSGRPGRVIRGYVSMIDGSTQPYGLIVPQGYDANRPMRLDVVLHGSTRPVGMSELRFAERFDLGDVAPADEKPPDSPYLELHPLGRVENGYRWAGEIDVYEAIEAVCRQYSVDRDRIVLRGMSMGASGTWHLGLKRPDFFAALGPYCGYVDTHRFSETPLPSFVKVGALPEVQERMLHLLDSVDYAANAGVVPAVACMGEKDVFFDAHVIMGQAMQREGLQMVNLISPGTGHVIDPQTHAEQMARIAAHVQPGLNHAPRSLRFVTWTLKYHRCHWLDVLGLERHYDRTEIAARLDDQATAHIDKLANVTRIAIAAHVLDPQRPKIVIDGREIAVPPREPKQRPSWIVLERRAGTWTFADVVPDAAAPPPTRGKRPGLQGPIDDAFTAPFLCVRGTGKPWNPATADWANASLDRFAYEWRRYFRGDLPVKDDSAITADDLRDKNLILFGDPGSNRWIRDALPHLPLDWSAERLTIAGQSYAAADHAPALITASPLPGAERRYLVLNSGHTFHEPELSTLNYLLFPRLGDWAVMRIEAPRKDAPNPTQAVVETPVAAGLADESWAIK